MTALSEDKRRKFYGEPTRGKGPVKGSTTLYEGALLAFDSTGFLVPAGDTAAHKVAGVCVEQVVNSGSDGDKTAEFDFGQTERFVTSVLVAADRGDDAVAEDDATLTDAAAATNDVPMGKIIEIESGFAWIEVGVLTGTNA